MSAGKFKIVCEQGATFSLEIQWKDSNDVPVDLSAYTARMHVKRDKTSEYTVVELTTENSRITLDALDGSITLSLPPSITETIDPFNYVYDLELESATGVVTRLLEGQFFVEGEVTKG